MNLDLDKFDLIELMGALGAGESALRSFDDDPSLPAIFRGQGTNWANSLKHLSEAIEAAARPGFINNNPENGWTP